MPSVAGPAKTCLPIKAAPATLVHAGQLPIKQPAVQYKSPPSGSKSTSTVPSKVAHKQSDTVTLTSQNRADLLRVSAAAATAVMQEMGVDHFLTKHYLTEVQKLLPQGWIAVGWHFGRIYWLDTVLHYTTWTLPIAPAGIKPPVTEGPFPPPPPLHASK